MIGGSNVWKCPNCDFEQASGNYCERCGTMLPNPEAAIAKMDVQEQEENLQQDNGPEASETKESSRSRSGEKIKRELNNYWTYFVTLLKNPSLAFLTNEKYFTYGLVNIGLFALFYALAVYLLANSIFRSIGGFFMMETSMPFSYMLSMLFVMLVLVAIAFFSAFVMTKAAKSKIPLQKMVAQFGALFSPFVALNGIAFVGAVIRSAFLTVLPLLISVSLALLYVPVLFVYEKAAEADKKGQKVYYSLLTVVLIFAIAFLLGDALLSRVIQQLDDMFYYLF